MKTPVHSTSKSETTSASNWKVIRDGEALSLWTKRVFKVDYFNCLKVKTTFYGR